VNDFKPPTLVRAATLPCLSSGSKLEEEDEGEEREEREDDEKGQQRNIDENPR
jgi:hypothetical protein